MYVKVKRSIDIFLSLFGVILLAPIFAVVSILIKLDTPGPVIFRQKRIGAYKKEFYMFKFRTMYIDAPQDTPTHLIINPNKYITKFGKTLRKLSLDELPQLINILKGDMSFVGPRPALWNQYDLIELRDKYEANEIPVGITGLAQVNGRDELSIKEKAKLDGEYAKKVKQNGLNWLVLDFICFVKTFLIIIKRKGYLEGAAEENKNHNNYENEMVSIIMPAYNSERYIKNSIESVRNQTYKRFELIIVNDASTDNTWKIINYYAKMDERIHGISLEKNLGVAAARNVALERAAGRYIAFLDSDDLWVENKLEKQIEFLKKGHIGFTYGNYYMFNEKNKVVKAPEKFTHKKLLKNTGIACLTVMLDRNIIGDFRMPEIEHAEDTFTWYSILQRGFIAYNINEILGFYRTTNKSMTSNKFKSAINQWKNYRSFLGLSILDSSWYFLNYSINAILKHWR